MNRRPLSITIVSWMFIASGSVGLVYHLSEHLGRFPTDYGLVEVSLIRLFAILAGALVLRGVNRARWLLVVWMAYHIVLSAAHSTAQLALHILLFGTISYFLFRPSSSAFFRAVRTSSPRLPTEDEKTAA